MTFNANTRADLHFKFCDTDDKTMAALVGAASIAQEKSLRNKRSDLLQSHMPA